MKRKCSFCGKEFKSVISKVPFKKNKTYSRQLVPITIGTCSYHAVCFNEIVRIIRELKFQLCGGVMK